MTDDGITFATWPRLCLAAHPGAGGGGRSDGDGGGGGGDGRSDSGGAAVVRKGNNGGTLNSFVTVGRARARVCVWIKKP